MSNVIIIIIGLFIWLVLPTLLGKKTKNKNYKKFYKLSFTILGLFLINTATIHFIQDLLNYQT